MHSRTAGHRRDASRSRALHALLAMTLLTAASADAQRARYTPQIFQQAFLENGLEIVAVRNPSSPMATVIVAVRGGGATQSNEMAEGVPHYLEHLLFKSSATFGSEVSQAEGSFNGTTSEEVVKYFITAPGKNAPQAVKALGNLVRGPKFRDDDMKTEVNVVRNELERRISDQRFLLDFTVDQELWGTAWSRKNVGGNAFALIRSTPQSIENFYKQFYTPNNSAVIISGDIDVPAVMTAAKEAFKGWKKGPDESSATTFEVPALKATKVLPALDGTGTGITLELAWQGPSAQVDSIGAMSASLVSAMLNNRNSEFQRQLVDSRLFESVQISYQMLNHSGPIRLIARTSRDQFVEATAALQAQLAKLAAPDAFGDEDLRLAKKYFRVANALEWERGSTFAHEIADHWSVAGLESFLGYADAVAARTPADLRGFIQKYVAGKPKIVAVVIAPQVRTTLGRTYQTTMGSWYTK